MTGFLFFSDKRKTFVEKLFNKGVNLHFVFLKDVFKILTII